MKWFSKKSVKRLSAAVAFSIVTGLNMGGAEAAAPFSLDVSGETADITSSSDLNGTVLIYGYDKTTGKIQGPNYVNNNKKFANKLALRAEDIKGLSADKVLDLLNQLGEKILRTEDSTNGVLKLWIVDKENKPLLEAGLKNNPNIIANELVNKTSTILFEGDPGEKLETDAAVMEYAKKNGIEKADHFTCQYGCNYTIYDDQNLEVGITLVSV